MPRAPKICYWCGDPEHGREHVPPSNLFNPAEELHPITVPSCKAHNQEFHLLDERMRFFLQTASSSELAITLFRGKTIRGMKKSPGLMRTIAAASMPGSLDGVPTIAIRADAKDHDTYFEKLARGLYFHEFSETFPGVIKSVCTHCFDQSINLKETILLFHTASHEMKLVVTSHPDVFRYQIGRVVEGEGTGFFLRMAFYNDITVLAVGTAKGTGQK